MLTTATTSAAAIGEGIGASWARFLSAGARQQSPHAYLYASAYRACDRRIVYEMTQPETLPAFPPEVLAKFRRGDDRERDLLADLSRIGRDSDPAFNLIGQQERFTLRDKKGRPAIIGKVDARLDLRPAGLAQTPPLEVKAWSPFLVDRIETFEDLFANPWTQSGGYQLLSYLFGAGEPYGFLLLDRSGVPKLLPVELEKNLDRMEAFLVKAERALDHVAAGTLPDFIDDADECKRCPWYGGVCNPPLYAHGAIEILNDPALEAALTRRELLKAAGEEFNDLDKEIKGRLRGVERGVAGAFQILGRWGKSSRLDLPEPIKRQYTVTDPRGRFTLEITKR